MAIVEFPRIARDRGPGYWLRFGNLWAARRKFFRSDHSVDWRDAYDPPGAETFSRSVPFSRLHGNGPGAAFRFAILGDTGEGDRSQYGLVPLLRAVKPDFMIINGDVAYPAGNLDDYDRGFFEPYRDLGIPIWAVPGNHEYYSKYQGREFHELFCTRKFGERWTRYGLRLVPQPGTYWELREEPPGPPLVVIGVDSLKKANLEGKGWRRRADQRQHEWLRWRLDSAERDGRKVIVLFHIPALVKAERDRKVHLDTVHRLLAQYACVKLVVSAHEHNFQVYRPDMFARFLCDQYGAQSASPTHYLVSGGGGAYLTTTTFQPGTYETDVRYPTPDQWKEYASRGRRIVEAVFGKSAIARAVIRAMESIAADGDVARYLSFLLVDVSAEGAIEVIPVFMDRLAQLFSHLPEAETVLVPGGALPDAGAVERCKRAELRIQL